MLNQILSCVLYTSIELLQNVCYGVVNFNESLLDLVDVSKW